MERIPFKNDGEPGLSKETLEKLQDNIEYSINSVFKKTEILKNKEISVRNNENKTVILDQRYVDFDIIVCSVRGDYNNIQNCILFVGTHEIQNVSIVAAEPTSWAGYGFIRLQNNSEIYLQVSKTYGWEELTLCNVYGINIKAEQEVSK